MLQKVNLFLTRYMPILTPLSLVIGVLFQQVGQELLFLVVWLFAIMTFIGSLSMKFSDIRVFVTYPKTILLVIAFLHIFMPIWAYLLAELIFHNHYLTIGFVLAVAVPTGVTSLIWVTITKGNVALCLAIIFIDTMLAPFIMPFLIQLVAGEAIQLNVTALMIDLVWMVVLPSLFGVLVNEGTKGAFSRKFNPILGPISKLCLFAIVMINSSAIAPYVASISVQTILIILLVFFITISGYFFILLFTKWFYKGEPAIVSTLLFNGGMRNIALGVVIATTYFPAIVAMPVIFGMLFQQVSASFFATIHRKYLVVK